MENENNDSINPEMDRETKYYNYKKSRMDEENKERTEHNEYVSKIRNYTFENNLTEIKDYLTEKYKELLPPYTKEEVDKWNFVHLIPKDLYLYLTNISRKIYTHISNEKIITEKTFDSQQDYYEDCTYGYYERETEEYKTFINNHNTLIKTQLFISYDYIEDFKGDRYYLSSDNIITCVDNHNDKIHIKSSFADFLYDNNNLEYRKLHEIETYDPHLGLKCFARTYNFLRIINGMPGLSYSS